jgi:aminopeptidase N
MREGTAPLVRREDYTAPAFWIRTVDLTFDLEPSKTLVISRMQLERNVDVPAQPLRLHGEELNLTRVLVNGESVSFRHEDGQLVIDSLQGVPPGPFTLEIRNTCAPDRNTQLSGLYTSGGGFFTQCEAEGFRRITYFLDRPDVMAVYTVTLRANKASSTTDATSPSGTTRSPSPATCSPWSPPTWSRASSGSPRARARTTCCRCTCAAVTSTRPSMR